MLMARLATKFGAANIGIDHRETTEETGMAGFTFKTPDGASYKYATAAALSQFVSQELATWSWLSQHQGLAAAQGLNDSIVRPLLHAQQSLGQQPPTEATTETARSQVQKYFDSKLYLHPKSPLRVVVDKLAKKSPAEAIYMLATIGQQSGKWAQFSDQLNAKSTYVAGITKGVAYLEGWSSDAKANAAAVSAEQSAHAAGEALTATGTSRDKAEEILNFFSQWEAGHRERLSTLNDTIRQEHEQLSSELREDWKRLTATYDSQLALRAPATYWGKKHRKHTNWVTWLAIGGSLWLIVGAIALYVLAKSVFGLATVDAVPSWFQVLSFSLGVLVFVLVLRSVLKLMMSHVHLSLDAAERQTMIVSYLSLVRKGALKEEALEKVLGAIFRPTGDGIVKDDGVPLSVLAELFKRP
ncbi:MAG: hypothetical protein IBJ14_14405 [Hydrogenophaga sp.]|nr:hypothetical protein [Hydrogenophaga sp.]